MKKVAGDFRGPALERAHLFGEFDARFEPCDGLSHQRQRLHGFAYTFDVANATREAVRECLTFHAILLKLQNEPVPRPRARLGDSSEQWACNLRVTDVDRQENE